MYYEILVQSRKTAYACLFRLYLLFHEHFCVSADFVLLPEVDLVEWVWLELLGFAHLPQSRCVH